MFSTKPYRNTNSVLRRDARTSLTSSQRMLV
jgi:hypothetical protein